MTNENLPDLHKLDTEVRQSYGETPLCEVRAETEMDIYRSPARMWKPQAGYPGSLFCTCEVDQRVTL